VRHIATLDTCIPPSSQLGHHQEEKQENRELFIYIKKPGCDIGQDHG